MFWESYMQYMSVLNMSLMNAVQPQQRSGNMTTAPISALIYCNIAILDLTCTSPWTMTFRCSLIMHKHVFRIKKRGLNSRSPSVFIPTKALRRNGEWRDTDDFLLHFSPISCCCVHLQLSHLICCFVAVSAAPTSLSRLSHCCWCCSDSGKAAMRSYLEERNIFHWAKSRWSRRIWELCYERFIDLITISKLILLLPGWYLFFQSTPRWSSALIYCLGLVRGTIQVGYAGYWLSGQQARGSTPFTHNPKPFSVSNPSVAVYGLWEEPGKKFPHKDNIHKLRSGSLFCRS